MKTFQAQVYVRNGSSKIAHTVRIQADSVFGARELLRGQYGAENVIGTPTEVTGSSGTDLPKAPWM